MGGSSFGEVFSKLKKIKGIGILAVLFVIGIFMIIISSASPGNQAKQTAAAPNETFNEKEYTDMLEAKLKKMIQTVKNAGDAEVMITLESGIEYYYERNMQTRDSSSGETKTIESESEIVFENDRQSGQYPILVKQILPKIKGIAIVCRGASDVEVKKKIIEIVSCAMNLPSNRICVVD